MKYHGARFGQKLIDEGVCPPNARNVEFHVPADGAVFVRFDVLIDSTDIPKIQRALEAIVGPEVPA